MSVVELDLLTAVASDADEFTIGSSAISLASHSTTVHTDTELLLRLDEQYGPPQDSSGKAPAVIDHGGVRYGQKFSGSKGYGIRLNGTGGLRIDSYPGVQTNQFTIRAIIHPTKIYGKHVILHKAFEDNMIFSLYISAGELIFEYRNFLNEYTSISSGVYVADDTTYLLGFSFDPAAARFSINGTVTTHSLTGPPSKIYNQAPIYIGFDGSVDHYEGYLDEIEFLSSAIVAFDPISDPLYSTESPYVEFVVPVSAVNFGNTTNINNVKILHLDLEKSQSSTGGLLVSIGRYGSATPRFMSGRESSLKLTSKNFVAYDAPQVVEELNRNITRFTQLLDIPFNEPYLTMRIYFMSDGSQSVTMTSAKLSYVDDFNAVSAGDDKEVIFGTSIRPFSDGGIATGATYPGPVSMNVDGYPYDLPTHAVLSGLGYGGEDISANDYFQYIRALTITADNNLIYPLSASNLLGTGQKSTNLLLSLSAGSHTDFMMLTVRPYWVHVYTRDHKGDTILSTLGDVAPRLTVYDSNDAVIVQDYYLTGDDYLSLIAGTYTFKVEQVDYADQSFEVSVYTDRVVELLVAPPKLRGTRKEYDTSIYVEAIYVDHDIKTIKQYDTPRVTFRIVDPNTALPKNLQGYRVYFRARQKYGVWARAIDRECTVSTEVDGIAYVDLVKSDTSSQGEFVGEVSIVSGNTQLTSLSKILFNVLPSLNV
jgi:hypothetical protein